MVALSAERIPIAICSKEPMLCFADTDIRTVSITFVPRFCFNGSLEKSHIHTAYPYEYERETFPMSISLDASSGVGSFSTLN